MTPNRDKFPDGWRSDYNCCGDPVVERVVRDGYSDKETVKECQNCGRVYPDG